MHGRLSLAKRKADEAQAILLHRGADYGKNNTKNNSHGPYRLQRFRENGLFPLRSLHRLSLATVSSTFHLLSSPLPLPKNRYTHERMACGGRDWEAYTEYA